jgi:hypothetical protein
MSEENQALETSAQQPVETESIGGDQSQTYSKEEVENLLKALRSEREARKIYEKEVKEKSALLEKFADVDPTKFRQLEQEAAAAAAAKAQADERTALLEEKYGAQAAEAMKKAESANKELLDFRKRYALEKVFFAAGGRTDSQDGVSFFDLLANQIGGQFRLESDGSVTVVDMSGDPVLDSDSGKRINPEDYLSQFKNHPIYGTFFKGHKGSGAGIGYGGTDSNGVMTDDLSSLSREELFSRAFG